MKFGHVLLLEEQAAPKELQGRFLQYKTLKKMLKRRLLTASVQDSTDPTGVEALQVEKDFLRSLRNQLKEVDRKFSSDAEAILSHYEVIGRQSRNPLHTLLTCKLVPRHSQRPEALIKLQQRVFWTRKYAELNATALRKIAKKRDKLCGGRVGECFLQACFRGQVAIHAILSLPILRELTAVEQLLSHQLASAGGLRLESPLMQPDQAAGEGAACTEPKREGGAELPAAVQETAQACAAAGGDAELERDFTCPVCMDVLFKSVALECGHVFCGRCAISLAVGHGRTVGDVERLLPTLAAYSAAYANRPCPSCRSTVHGRGGESVFWRVRRMKHLDRLIRQRYPAEWQRRRDEDAAEQAQLRAARADQSCLAFCCRKKQPDTAAAAGEAES